MPEIEKERFYTSQWDALWGYVLDNAGSVNDGDDGDDGAGLTGMANLFRA